MLKRPAAAGPQPPTRRRGARGFSITELMIGVALMSLLSALAVPSFGGWLRNAKVRTVADTLQNGLRLGQAEALRRYRQVVVFRTASEACDNTASASASGNHWALRTVPMVAGEPVETVRCGQLTDVAAGVAITGPEALCFSSSGRQVANVDPGVGGSACTLPAAGTTSRYVVSMPNADRTLRVLVTLGGSVRLCDPARTRATAPDGC